MLSDATWRKMPIDILTNENMTYIESQMPDGFEYAPFMFYQAALRKADDDGIFDLEDGVIFARLMRVPSEKLVFFVANLMGKRKMIARVSASSNKCLLTDWDYPKGTQPRTWAERRAIVQKMIADEQAHPAIAEEFSVSTPEEENFDSFEGDFVENSAEIDEKSVFGDKNQKNVTLNVFGDKKAENVTQKIVLEREIEREIEREKDKIREIRDTHTKRDRESVREEERKTDVEASAGFIENPAPAPTERKAAAKKRATEPKAETKKESANVSSEQKESESVPTSSEKSSEKVTDALFEVSAILEAFFVSNCFGFDAGKSKSDVLKIATRIKALETETITSSKIASTLVNEFKKMHDSEGVWNNIPLTPNMMMNEKVWAYLLNCTGKKVSTKKNQSFLEKVKEQEKEALAEKDELIAQQKKEYLKYGINPDDPNRFMLLMRAKKAESVPEAQYEGDIF